MSEKSSQDDLIGVFLDEELSEMDIDALLEQLECADTRSRACRQSLIGSVLRQRGSVIADISAGVREAIAGAEFEVEDSDTVVPLAARVGRDRQSRDWRVPAGGLALAASVAWLAIVAIRPAEDVGAGGKQLAQQVEAATGSELNSSATLVSRNSDGQSAPRELVIEVPEQSRPVVAQWGSADAGAQPVASSAQLREQLNAYLLNHARNGGSNALSGSLGYARVTASPRQQSEETQR